MSASPSPDSVFAEWERRRESGETLDFETLIEEHPEFADELRSRLEAVRLLEGTLGVEGGRPAPDRIGDHVIVREIGRGGMGVVYEAVQEGMERRVALKVLHPSVAPPRTAVDRFRQEAQLAGRLRHGNIVSVHALGHDAGVWWCAMELVDGPPLSRVIDAMRTHRKPGHPGDDAAPSTLTGESPGTSAHARGVAQRFAEVAEALAVAHAAGVLHRDVKPSNLLLGADGRLRLVDFGLARLEGDTTRLTRTGDMLGTPLYMSPERFRGTTATAASDVYSLGATLYETLALRPPHVGRDPARLAARILTREPAPLRALDPRVPRDLETIVSKALEKDPVRRYATAAAMADDLRAFAHGDAIRAKRAPLWRGALRPLRRHPARTVAAALALVGVGVAALLAGSAATERDARRAAEYRLLLDQAAATRPHDGDKDAREARRLYDRAIELEPGRPDAYVARAVSPGATREERRRDIDAARARGAPEGTVALLQVLAHGARGADADAAWARAGDAAGADDALAHLVAGRRADAAGDPAAAERQYALVLKGLPPTSPLRWPTLLAQYELHGRTEQHAKAIDDLHALQAAGDDRVRTAAQEAWLWRRLGNEAEANARADALVTRVAGDEARAVTAGRTWRGSYAFDWVERVTDRALERFTASVELWRLRAVAYDATNRREKAVEAWDRALGLAPGDGTLHAGRAGSLCNVPSRLPEALAGSERALTLAGDSAEVWRVRADVLRAAGRMPDCEVAARRAIELDPDERSAKVLLAICRYVAGRPDEGDAILLTLLKERPGDPYAGAALARSRFYREQFAGALEATEAPLRVAPESPDLLEVRGGALRKLGRLREGEDALRKALALRPSSPMANDQLGRLLSNQKRWAEAEPYLRRLTELQPTDAIAWNQFGVALHEQRKDEPALKAFEQAVRLAPTVTLYLANQGGTLSDLGKYQEALDVLRRVVALRPKDAIDRFNLAIAYANVGDVDGAIREYAEAARLDPTDPVAVVRQAVLLMQSGRGKDAVPLWNAAIARAPKDSTIHHDYAVALEALGRATDAEGELREAIRWAPRDAESHAMLGHLLLARGANQEALEHLDVARKLDPMVPLTHLDSASALFELGEEGRAADLLVAAVERFEKHADLRFALAWTLADASIVAVRNATLAALHAREATSLDAGKRPYWVALGAALYRQERYAESVATLEKAAAMSGDRFEPQTSHYLAMALARSNRLADARTVFARAEAVRAAPGADNRRHRQRAAEVEDVLRSAAAPAGPAAASPPGGR